MNLTKKRKKKGFTLIELMAVIAIIAVLAAVLVPTVTGYITRAKKAAVITQARTVMNAVETYNQSASDTNKIKDTDTITTLASAQGKLGKDGFLSKNDINKLGGAKVSVIKAINNDPEAANNITLDGDRLSKYKDASIK